MIKVRRIGHATLSTPDVQRQADYFSNVVGLNVLERDDRRVVLATRHGVEALELVQGEPNQLHRVSFQIAPGSDLDDVAGQLRGLGLKAERRTDVSPGVAEAVAVEDPSGVSVDLFAEYRFAPLGPPTAFNVLKLGHVGSFVPDIAATVKFYSEVLGFKVSDWRGEAFVFMRCNTDHHTLNIFSGEKAQLHHIAFEVTDWPEINRIADSLAQNDVRLVWGPGRHVIGHNVSIYHRNSDLVQVEFYTDMDQMKDEALGYFDPRPWHQEFPLYPKTHGPETLRNYWGYGSERMIRGFQTVEIPQYGPHAAQAPEPPRGEEPSPAALHRVK